MIELALQMAIASFEASIVVLISKANKEQAKKISKFLEVIRKESNILVNTMEMDEKMEMDE